MPHTDAIVVSHHRRLRRGSGEASSATLLERRLIACGTLFPGARSLYRWQGKIADEREVVVHAQDPVGATRLASRRRSPSFIRTRFPSCSRFPVEAGLEKYLEWINGETTLALS